MSFLLPALGAVAVDKIFGNPAAEAADRAAANAEAQSRAQQEWFNKYVQPLVDLMEPVARGKTGFLPGELQAANDMREGMMKQTAALEADALGKYSKTGMLNSSLAASMGATAHRQRLMNLAAYAKSLQEARNARVTQAQNWIANVKRPDSTGAYTNLAQLYAGQAGNSLGGMLMKGWNASQEADRPNPYAGLPYPNVTAGMPGGGATADILPGDLFKDIGPLPKLDPIGLYAPKFG